MMARRARISLILLATLLLFPAAAWLFFPVYAPHLLNRMLADTPARISFTGLGRPGFTSLGFASLSMQLTMPAGDCSREASHIRISSGAGSLRWGLRRLGANLMDGLRGTLRLQIQSVTISPDPAVYQFRDAAPTCRASIDIAFREGIVPSLRLSEASCTIRNGQASLGNLQVEGIAYRARLIPEEGWASEPDTLSIRGLRMGETALPLSAFKAIFSTRRAPDSPCTLLFSECRLHIMGLPFSAPCIAYDSKLQRTDFTLSFDDLNLDALNQRADATAGVMISGSLSGAIPVSVAGSRLRIEDAFIRVPEKASLTFLNENRQPFLSLDLPAGPFLEGFTLDLGWRNNNGKPEHLDITKLSGTLAGGSIHADPTTIRIDGQGHVPVRLILANSELPGMVHLHGSLEGSIEGSLYASIPIVIGSEGIALNKAVFSLDGVGNLTTITPPRKATIGGEILRIPTQKTDYRVSSPMIHLTRTTEGKISLDFTIADLSRKMPEEEMALCNLRGSITMFEKKEAPSLMRLLRCSAELLGGNIALSTADIDLGTLQTSTVLTFSGIPLQTLIRLQGNDRLLATGSLKGSIPINYNNGLFAINNGSMAAETGGHITYITSREERETANPGLKTTYEALSNFYYTLLSSTLTMAPEGTSRLAVTLHGKNPDFQSGRPIELNLVIDQNLLALMQSLTIPAGIEQGLIEQVSPEATK